MKKVFTCDGSVLIIPPRMSDGGPNIECPAVLGENSWAWWDKNAPVSCYFLAIGFLLTALTLTFNSNPNTKSEQGTNLAPAHTTHSNLLILLKPQSHIRDFGPGRATVHPDLHVASR